MNNLLCRGTFADRDRSLAADYTSLRLTQLPSTGGDTLWASGYEVYDRFSKPYQKFFESLSATFIGDGFIKAAAANPEKVFIYDQPRGSPNNVGKELTAVHPVVRTNPVTGWKSIFTIGAFPKYINELNPDESEELLKKFYDTILNNHDLTVRLRWRNPNDIGESLSYGPHGILADSLQLSGTIEAPSIRPRLIMRALGRDSAIVL
jgi:alpha-ketoglutarate-dependent taurine dioxygenase